MKRRTVLSVMVVAMLFAVSLYFVGGTYARYAGEYKGTADGAIAKWAVKVDEDTQKDLTLTFNTDDNDYVVPGKIAPASSISSEMALDLEGTEVAVEVKAEISAAELATLKEKFGESADKVTVETSITDSESSPVSTPGEDGYTLIPLKGSAAFEAGKAYKVKVTIKWAHDNEEQNENDTSVGEGVDLSLKIPVTLSVRQHINKA